MYFRAPTGHEHVRTQGTHKKHKGQPEELEKQEQ